MFVKRYFIFPLRICKNHFKSTTTQLNWTAEQTCVQADAAAKAAVLSTHVAQGAAASPWGTQGSFSSSSGHSFSLPIGNCLMIRVRTRVPSGDAVSWHVFEQGPHSDHSDTWHSLVITQDWKVIGSFSCRQSLQKSIDILITGAQAVLNFLFCTPERNQPGQFYFYLEVKF